MRSLASGMYWATHCSCEFRRACSRRPARISLRRGSEWRWPRFDPAKIRKRFVISAGSYFCTLVVPDLIALARKSAPGITLQIVNTSADLAQALDQQQIDIALGAFDRVPARLRSEVLFHDEKAWAIGSHHPLAKQPFDHAAFLAWPRLAIGVATATDLSREPPARKDLVSRVIPETNDEADSPRLGQRATTSMMVYDATTAIRWCQPDRNDHAEFIRMLGATVAGSIPKGVKTLLALFGPHAMSKLSLFAAHGPNHRLVDPV
jgi:hypothetical protein